MCELCDGADGSIELTEDNVLYMLHEVTTVAIQAATIYSNGWFRGAHGLTVDMIRKWEIPGTARLAYVWGAASYFMPRPPDAPNTDPGSTHVAGVLHEATGQEPDPARVAHLVAVSEQATATMRTIVTAASRDELDVIADTMGKVPDRETAQATLALLLAEAAIRVRWAHETENETAMDLWLSHIKASTNGGGEDG